MVVPIWILSNYPPTNTQTRSYNGMYEAIRMNQGYNKIVNESQIPRPKQVHIIWLRAREGSKAGKINLFC